MQRVAKYFFRVLSEDFQKILGSPIAYWVSEGLTSIFDKAKVLSEGFEIKAGMSTTDNDLFLCLWYEVSCSSFKLDTQTARDCEIANQKWYPLN